MEDHFFMIMPLGDPNGLFHSPYCLNYGDNSTSKVYHNVFRMSTAYYHHNVDLFVNGKLLEAYLWRSSVECMSRAPTLVSH